MPANSPEDICRLFQRAMADGDLESVLRVIKHVVATGDIALMHTKWTAVSGPQPTTVYAIEVARRQADGAWCWLIGDPYTVGREVLS